MRGDKEEEPKGDETLKKWKKRKEMWVPLSFPRGVFCARPPYSSSLPHSPSHLFPILVSRALYPSFLGGWEEENKPSLSWLKQSTRFWGGWFACIAASPSSPKRRIDLAFERVARALFAMISITIWFTSAIMMILSWCFIFCNFSVERLCASSTLLFIFLCGNNINLLS